MARSILLRKGEREMIEEEVGKNANERASDLMIQCSNIENKYVSPNPLLKY